MLHQKTRALAALVTFVGGAVLATPNPGRAVDCGYLWDYKYNIPWQPDEHAHGQGGEFPGMLEEEESGTWELEGGPFLVSDPHYEFYEGNTSESHHVPGIGC